MRKWIDLISFQEKNLLAIFENEIVDEGVAIHNQTHLAAFAIVVAENYDAAPRYDPNAKIYWDALNNSNNEVLLKRLQGDGISISYTPEDPYDDGSGDVKMMVRRMLWDMIVNHRLAIYSGHSDDHPVFSPQDNIIFRTVHDYFTHGKLRKIFSQEIKKIGLDKIPSSEELTKILPKISLNKGGNIGHQFTLRGEFNSYSTHAKLAPAKALPALFTEVCGQVCYNVICGNFPQQKVAVLEGFDYKKIGIVIPGSQQDMRLQEIIKQIKNGIEIIEIKISVKPSIDLKNLMKTISK